MHPTGSMLKFAIERLVLFFEDATFGGKYSESDLIRQFIGPAVAEVFNLVNLDSSSLIYMKYTGTFAPDQHFYPVPVAMQEVERIVIEDENSRVLYDIQPRDRMNPCGFNWRIENNVIEFDNPLSSGDFVVYYIPTGDAAPHYHTAGTLASDLKTFTLNTTPALGLYDRRKNAFVGRTLRLLPVSGEHVEGTIESQASNVVTLRRPLDIAAGEYPYEICDAGFLPLWEAVAMVAAFKLATVLNASEKKFQQIAMLRASALKTVRDRTSNLQARTGKSFVRDQVVPPGDGLVVLRVF